VSSLELLLCFDDKWCSRDDVLHYNNHLEAIKQWTNIFGYSNTAQAITSNNPANGWTRSLYGPNFEAISGQGVPHNIPSFEGEVMKWFGLTNPAPSTLSTTISPTSLSSFASSGASTSSSTAQPSSPSSAHSSTSSLSSSLTTSSSTPNSTATAPTPTQTRWGQCGG